jgi:hypothetical protein
MLLHEVLGPPKALQEAPGMTAPSTPAPPSKNGHDRRHRDVEGFAGRDRRALPSPTQTEDGGVHSTPTRRDEARESGVTNAGIAREFAVRVSRAIRRAGSWLRRAMPDT